MNCEAFPEGSGSERRGPVAGQMALEADQALLPARALLREAEAALGCARARCTTPRACCTPYIHRESR
jgi:hypothetical protein